MNNRRIRLDVVDRTRMEKGFPKAKFLLSIGMSHKTYNALGTGSVHDNTILKLSKALDLPIEKFVEWGG